MEAVQHVAVLAGGRSSRMGVDKSVVRVGGMMMLERVVRVAKELNREVMVVGRAAAPEGWPNDIGARFLADQGEAFGGPIGGVVTALEEARGPVLVVGCDMPLLRVETLRALMAAHARSSEETWATMAVFLDEGEPMFAVYTPAILPRLKEMIRTGRRSLQPLLKENLVCRWEVPAEAVGELLNVNDAETLGEAERRLKVEG